jgi:tetratricopeptide (TPR) repeat protein
MRHKRNLFRWVAALVLPVVVLVLIELALRLAGWGYPTAFFLRSDSGPPGLFTENSKFGWRFFPPGLARAPDPIRLSQAKPPGTRRVFVFGESAALGDPEPAYGFSRILRELLEERCPGTKFEVINVAMTAISSHVISRIARDCVPFHGDIWIIYMGNNEVVGPFGPGSVFGDKAPPMPIIRASLAVKRTLLGQLLDALWRRVRAGRGQPRRWEGMKMMLNDQIRASDPVLHRVYDHFGRNLEVILSIATRAGVRPIVCSVASNLKDCPPFASLNHPGLSDARKAQWTRLFTAGTELESRKECEQALALYRRAAQIDDTYADLPFRMARCHLALGEATAAQEQFRRARDLDALRFRADSTINSIIRGICAHRTAQGLPDADMAGGAGRVGSVKFFNSEAALTNACAVPIPGAECFWDHVHLNFSGNYRLASGLADQVISHLPEHFQLAAESNRPLLTEADCAARLALTDWDRRLVLERMWRRVQEPPFTRQLDHEKLVEPWSGLLADLQLKTEKVGLAEDILTYRKALDRRKDDWLLHHRFGYLLEAAGNFPEAKQQWQRVIEAVPGDADAWFKLGDMSARQSQFVEAELDYNRVLRLRPDSFEAMNGLGLVRMSQGKLDEAAQFFERALRVAPDFAQAHVNLGLLLSHRGMVAEAEAHFREALRCDPASAGAHINLGDLLAAQQKHPEAIGQYFEAIKLQPHQATVHLSLANSLEATGRESEAVAHFQEAIRLDPALADAHFNLAVALARHGNLPAATRGFEEAVRLNPDDPQAHLSLGVALAQQKRLSYLLHRFAKEEQWPVDPFFSHHGSLSKEVREVAETTLKNGQPVVVLATSSLELGIDLGDVVRVLQGDPCWSVSSLR